MVKIIQQTNIKINDDDLEFLHMEGRYPDYLFRINKICDAEYTTKILEEVKIIKICLQEKLQ